VDTIRKGLGLLTERAAIPDTWIESFLKKSGDDEIINLDKVVLLDEGFMSFEKLGDIFFLHQLFWKGTGKELEDLVNKFAKASQCKCIAFITKRNYRVFERKYKYKFKGHLMYKEVV